MLRNYFKIIAPLAIACFSIGCTSENAEELYQSNDAVATVIYNDNLKGIIDTKCISCHVYHLEGTNRYDNFEKTKSSITQMLARINVSSNIKMPPADSPQLTAEEKEYFQNFSDILFDTSTNKKVEVTWTAYKYPDFNTRAGVSGTFNELTHTLNENYSEPIDILNNAMVTINTASVNVGNEPERTENVGVFFSSFTSQIIGVVDSYTNENALITFTMNGISKQLEFNVSLESDKIILDGTVPDLSLFNWQTAYNMLNAVCGEHHEQKLWEDVSISIEIALN